MGDGRRMVVEFALENADGVMKSFELGCLDVWKSEDSFCEN